MRMIYASVGLAALLSITGCDDGATPAGNVNRIVIASEQQRRLETMDPVLRNATFMRAIRDSGESCNRVDQSTLNGRHEDLPMWSARCSGGSEWAIFVAPDGGVQIRSCEQMVQLGLPPCRFDPETPDAQSTPASSEKS